ncbi:hypothetical protein RCL1_002144 [Eukaryota sp. TZLM3-RCL]
MTFHSVLEALQLDALVSPLIELGISSFLPPQERFLTDPDIVHNSRNFLVCFPTGQGKTLIGDLLMIRSVLITRSFSLLIVPFIALAQQRFSSLQPLCAFLNIPLYSYYGSSGSLPLPSEPGIIVATIEKASSIISFSITSASLLSFLCIDELQIVGDGQERGALLEGCISKVLFSFPDCRIGAFSATISNDNQICSWLNAKLFKSTDRCVPLFYYICRNGKVVDCKGILIRELKNSSENLIDNVYEIISQFNSDDSCIIFCSTKLQCESVSKELAFRINYENNVKFDLSEVNDLKLRKLLPKGVAFHHSSLSFNDKSLVEESFLNKNIRIIAATSSLSAGVDLPCRFVIITSPFMGIRQLTKSELNQMAGRSGRKGHGLRGDCFLISNQDNHNVVVDLLSRDLDPTLSKLDCNQIFAQKFVLDILATFIANTPSLLRKFYRKSFYYECFGRDQTMAFFKTILTDLIDNYELVSFDPTTESFSLTNKGLAVATCHLSPLEGLSLIKELDNCLFSLGDDFQFCFHIVSTINTPLNPDDFTMFWFAICDDLEVLSESHKNTLTRLNVDLNLISKFVKGRRLDCNKENDALFWRAILCVFLYKIVCEVEITDLSRIYCISTGTIEAFKVACSTRASSLSVMCNAMNWPVLGYAFAQLSERIAVGARKDLVDSGLLSVPKIGPRRARKLVSAGVKSLKQFSLLDSGKVASLLDISEFTANSILTCAIRLCNE